MQSSFLSYFSINLKKKTKNKNFCKIICDFSLLDSQKVCNFYGLRGVGSVKKEEEQPVLGGNGLKWEKKIRKVGEKGFRIVGQ